MPKFIDVHSLKEVDEKILRKTRDAPKDEFGVTHDNILYNKEEDKFYCLLDAPSKDAVVKHHEKHGFKPEWITEVKTTKAS
ncbi:MAG: nickel-binding protein [Nitrososphaeraceae archaeon]